MGASSLRRPGDTCPRVACANVSADIAERSVRTKRTSTVLYRGHTASCIVFIDSWPRRRRCARTRYIILYRARPLPSPPPDGGFGKKPIFALRPKRRTGPPRLLFKTSAPERFRFEWSERVRTPSTPNHPTNPKVRTVSRVFRAGSANTRAAVAGTRSDCRDHPLLA